MPTTHLNTVRHLWQKWLKGCDFHERHAQWEMIEQIVLTLKDMESLQSGGIGVPYAVIEAPTGTGKTAAYLLASIVMARHLHCKVVIATSTIALQSQILNQDIPSLLEHTDLDFSYALAKGRRNYLCVLRAQQFIDRATGVPAQQALYPDEEEPLLPQRVHLCQSMLAAVDDRSWHGDLDDWRDDDISKNDKQALTVDSHQCQKRKCPKYEHCCYYKARHAVKSAECVITNHALVLADQQLEGGVLLPSAEENIYIFDEAHHLNRQSCDSSSLALDLTEQTQWMRSLGVISGQLVYALKQANTPEAQYASYLNFGQDLDQLRTTHRALIGILQNYASELKPRKTADGDEFLFDARHIPPDLRDHAKQATTECDLLQKGLARTQEWLCAYAEDQKSTLEAKQLFAWSVKLGSCGDALGTELALWKAYSDTEAEGIAPKARWFAVQHKAHEKIFKLCARSVIGASIMKQFWESCAGTIMTSATLAGADSFETFINQLHLPEGTRTHRIAEVFDYGRAEFVVPDIGSSPNNEKEHNDAVANYLNHALRNSGGSLVIFNSRAQLKAVLNLLDRDVVENALIQGDTSVSELLRRHCEKIDNLGRSAILGLASFAEGINLPGEYCVQVIINKLSFPVPNTPEMRTLESWCQERGENAFLKVSVPEAITRLRQCAGRLLRKEDDSGRVVLLDMRIMHKRYGKTILDALPPFKQVLYKRM